MGVGDGGWELVQDGHTALQFAANNGHIEVVRELLGKGADVNKVDKVNKLTLLDIYAHRLSSLGEQGDLDRLITR